MNNGHPCFAWICAGMAVSLSLAGCATDAVYRPDQLIRVETPAYVAELIKPETARFGNRKARFVEGGWLIGLTPKALGVNILHDRAVIPGYSSTRGLPLEFIDVFPLGGNRFLRPGVGIVLRKTGAGRFNDRAWQRFPWFTDVTADADRTIVCFRQFAPHFYFFTRTFTFRNDTNRIAIQDEFVNIGSNALRSSRPR